MRRTDVSVDLTAKSQQNLTPEDTDLIELTLDTLFSLDKLMHLLRSRRGSIEQTGMRIKWEELRIGAWKDRKAILDDVDRFVRTRARWSPEVYDSLGDVNADATGEGSTATQPPLLRSPTTKFLALARSARFKRKRSALHVLFCYSRWRCRLGDPVARGRHIRESRPGIS